MVCWGTPDWNRDHFSFRSIDSFSLSSGDISGLIKTGHLTNPLFERILIKTEIFSSSRSIQLRLEPVQTNNATDKRHKQLINR